MRKIRDNEGKVHDAGTLETTLNESDECNIGCKMYGPSQEWKKDIFRSVIARLDAEKEFHSLLSKLFGEKVFNYEDVFQSSFGTEVYSNITFTREGKSVSGVIKLGVLRRIKLQFQ